MDIESICNRDVDTVLATESVIDAAKRMATRNVGSLIVIDDERRPIGIVTDRDLTIRVLAGGHPPTTTIGEVMTDKPRIVKESHAMDAALNAMQAVPCRRLPVVDDTDKLVGILTLDDIHRYHAEEGAMMEWVLRREGPDAIANS